ncbi:MAG TPA: hypothetical protein VJL80_04050 [Aeromicrobium sp.]|nr:hypothetical protein [Aeromicrobium sp.]HKY57193.1 hypothetical protein [Aeromicrobium sp.]
MKWAVLTALAVAATLVAIVLTDRQPVRGEYCTADVGATHAQIDMEQARWVTLMSAISQRRGLPPRATTIAIATAFQESRIHNIDYGDRDSVGLFQQRPSQGWGTRDQLMNPTYAINAFYDALVNVDGYETMIITDAAQRVQRSGFPGAYAQHEDYARALASALRGYSTAAFSCSINPTGGGLTAPVRADLIAAFGQIPIQTSNTTIVLPLTGTAPDVAARGWGFAHYAVGNAARLQIASVSFDGHEWSAADSPEGWLPAPTARPDRVVVRMQP